MGRTYGNARDGGRTCGPLTGAKRALRRRAIHVRVLATLACAALFCSCGFLDDRDEAVKLANRYFDLVVAGDTAATAALYAPRFFEATSREKWASILAEVRQRCGTPKSHTLKNWNANSQIGTNAGSYATVIFDVEYTQCHIEETILTFRPDDGERKILGHHFQFQDGPITLPAKNDAVT